MVRIAYYKYIIFEDTMSRVFPKPNVYHFIPIVTGMPSRGNSVVSAVDQKIMSFFGIRGTEIEINNVCSVLPWITNYNRVFLKHHPAV